jgi:hypothetical protein
VVHAAAALAAAVCFWGLLLAVLLQRLLLPLLL